MEAFFLNNVTIPFEFLFFLTKNRPQFTFNRRLFSKFARSKEENLQSKRQFNLSRSRINCNDCPAKEKENYYANYALTLRHSLFHNSRAFSIARYVCFQLVATVIIKFVIQTDYGVVSFVATGNTIIPFLANP